ncbi:MAG: hypothetical protein WD037_11290 [Balneolales bacterium]
MTYIRDKGIAKDKLLNQISDSRNKSCYVEYLVKDILNNCRSWALVGGAPRTWLTDSIEKPNDLDIVVNTQPDILNLIITSWAEKFSNKYGITVEKTKLGGYRLVNPDLVIDIWIATKTINIERGKINDSNIYRAVAKSAALSLDSLVFTSKGTVYDHGFFKTLETGILSLNHCQVIKPKNIAIKAAALCKKYRLTPDLSLQALMSSYAIGDYLQ